jgi:brefeldin A-resistance guanine nucleotide exchange factor 1
MLLVMQASGVLIPPQIPGDRPEELQRRWELTREQMDRFLPGFLFEIIPPPVAAAPDPLVQGIPPAPESVEPAS